MTGFISACFPTTPIVGGQALVVGEPDAMGIDFTYATDLTRQAFILDSVTPANNYLGTPLALLTYTSPTVKMCRQSDGFYRHGNHNLFQGSEALNGGYWGPGGHGTVTNDDTTAPNGTVTADKHVGLDSGEALGLTGAAVPILASWPYRWSGYFKRGNFDWMCIGLNDGAFASGVNQFINLNTVAVGSTTSYGSGWSVQSASATAAANGFVYVVVNFTGNTTALRPFTFSASADGSSTRADVGSGAGVGTSYHLWGLQLRQLPVEDDGSLTDYIATTSAVRFDMPYEWDASGVLQGVLLENDTVNECLWSNDMTNAAWTKTTMTTAKTATGPDNVANSATTLTASGANATVLQAITSASAQRMTSMFVKRRTGTGAIQMTQDNGTTWTPVTVTAAWTRVNIPSSTAANPTVGIRIVTNADAIDVWGFDHDNPTSTYQPSPFITSPIMTTSASVTRSPDDLRILNTAYPHSLIEGTYTIAAQIIPYPVLGTYKHLIAVNNNSTTERYVAFVDIATADVELIIQDGGVEQWHPSFTSTAPTDRPFKTAFAYKLNDCAMCVNGGTVQSTVTATMPTPTITMIGIDRFFGATCGYIRQVSYIKRRATNAQLQARTV